jgi:hypothetical protein
MKSWKSMLLWAGAAAVGVVAIVSSSVADAAATAEPQAKLAAVDPQPASAAVDPKPASAGVDPKPASAGVDPKAASAAVDSVLARGEYLILIMGCNDCHTPLKMGPKGPEPDMSRMLSGHPQEMPLEPLPKVDPAAPWNWSGLATLTAFAGPWGVSVAKNITPDAETGLGKWTEEQFTRSMKLGKHLGVAEGRPILPPMPYVNVAAMSDDDRHALWVYLRSIPAIRNASPESIPAPPPPPGE